MITKLRGHIDEVDADAIDLDVSGVIYRVLCSKRTLNELQGHTEEVKVFTEMAVREDSMTLYGFASAYERDCFRTLTSVQGVGMKVGLAILAIGAPGQIFDAISAQDKTFITQADGVGPKLASRILNELKDKIGPRLNLKPHSSESSVVSLSNEMKDLQDAVSALVNLGFKAFDADRAVRSVVEKNPQADMNEMIRSALANLSGSA